MMRADSNVGRKLPAHFKDFVSSSSLDNSLSSLLMSFIFTTFFWAWETTKKVESRCSPLTFTPQWCLDEKVAPLSNSKLLWENPSRQQHIQPGSKHSTPLLYWRENLKWDVYDHHHLVRTPPFPLFLGVPLKFKSNLSLKTVASKTQL